MVFNILLVVTFHCVCCCHANPAFKIGAQQASRHHGLRSSLLSPVVQKCQASLAWYVTTFATWKHMLRPGLIRIQTTGRNTFECVCTWLSFSSSVTLWGWYCTLASSDWSADLVPPPVLFYSVAFFICSCSVTSTLASFFPVFAAPSSLTDTLASLYSFFLNHFLFLLLTPAFRCSWSLIKC